MNLNKILTIALVAITLSLPFFHNQALAINIQNNDTIGTQTQQTELPLLLKPDFLPGPIDPTGQNNPEDIQKYFMDKLIPMVSQRLVTIIALLSIVSLFYAGFKYYTAFGDEGKADEGKKIATYAILGLVLSLMSLAIVSIIGGLAQFFQ